MASCCTQFGTINIDRMVLTKLGKDMMRPQLASVAWIKESPNLSDIKNVHCTERLAMWLRASLKTRFVDNVAA